MGSTELKHKIEVFREMEARSCLMESSLITPEYVFRMWEGKVPLEKIEKAMK